MGEVTYFVLRKRDPMALTLSSTDLARIRAAQDVLLAPLAAPTAQAWGVQVVEALAAVFGAETGVMRLPYAGAPMVDWGTDGDLGALYDHFVVEPQATGSPLLDPIMEQSTRLRLARGVHSLSYARLDRLLDGTLDRSTFFHETRRAHPHREMLGLIADFTRDGVAVEGAVHLYCRRDVAFGDDALDVLELLRPALDAGVGAAYDLDSRRATLDALDMPLVVCDVDGRVIHETRSLTAALAGDERAGHVRAEALRLAADLGGGRVDTRPERAVSTSRGRYALRATRLPEGAALGPRPGVLVTIDVPTSPWPAEAALRERFGLTRREAGVALLLARGLANDAVADALCISPHTARRHTERVMAKLDVSARAQVAAAVLAGP